MDDEAVELVGSRPREWARRFDELKRELRGLLGLEVEVEHIGSTAIPGLPAKDVVDVLLGVAEGSVAPVAQLLVVSGFTQDGQRDGHAWLARKVAGRRVCVVHIVEAGSDRWRRRIEFRDLLRRDERACADYLLAKQAAAERWSTWGDYTAAKYETVQRLLAP